MGEDFVSGRDTSKLGECMSQLLTSLECADSNAPVAEALDAIGEDLVDLLPRFFPKVFEGHVSQKIRPFGVCLPLRAFKGKGKGNGKGKGQSKRRADGQHIEGNENESKETNEAWA